MIWRLLLSFYLFSFLNLSGFAQVNYLAVAKSIANIDSSINYIEHQLNSKKLTPEEESHLICYISELYGKKTRYYKAEKILSSYIIKLQETKDSKTLALVYNQLGNIFKLKRDVAQALKYYLKAIQILEHEKSYSELTKVYVNIAEYYRSLGQYLESKKYIHAALNMYQNRGLQDASTLVKIYGRLAAIQNESVPGDSSITSSLIALNLARQINDLNSQAISLNELGFSYKNRRKLALSRKCYQEAYRLWDSMGYDADAAHARFNEAQLLSHNYSDKKLIIPYYKNIIQLVTAKAIDYPLDQVYFELSNCYLFLGDSLSCYKIRQKYFEALLAKRQKLFDSEVKNIEEKYETEVYKKQIASVTTELEDKNKEINLFYVAFIVVIPFIIIIAFLLFKIKKSNKILTFKNKEKDSLVQEIHHRVKNNLQFISSLINMQINTNRNKIINDSLVDISRRIHSMALVHEMLYKKDDTSGIEIKKYIEELIDTINELVNSNNISIQFNINCESMIFEVSTATSIGIITSELVSNSIKHAFHNTQTPIIDITLKSINGQIEYCVRDNGIGINIGKETKKNKLGLRLINIFSRQIRGEYIFRNDNGLVFTLNFKYD